MPEVEEQSEWFDFGTNVNGKKTIITNCDVVIGPFGGDDHTLAFGSTVPGNPRFVKKGEKLYLTTGLGVLTELVYKKPELPVYATNTTAKKALGIGKEYRTPKGYNRTTY